MALTAAEILSDELAALGLKPGASATQVNVALRAHYPTGLAASQHDPRTGLPYTSATAKDAGSGNLAGQIVGGAFLTETVVGGILGGIDAAAGSAAGADAAAAGGETTAAAGAGDAAAGGAAGSAATNIAKGVGLADLLGVSGIEGMLVRGLEALVGVALILLGLSALAGGSGNPVSVAKTAAAKGARFF